MNHSCLLSKLCGADLCRSSALLFGKVGESAAKFEAFQPLGPPFEIVSHVLEDLASGLYVHMLGLIAAAFRLRAKVGNLIRHHARTN